jgi:hypothetical protein
LDQKDGGTVEFGGMVAWKPRFLRATCNQCYVFCVACIARGSFGVMPWPRINAQGHFNDNSSATDGMMHRLPSLGLVYDT